MRDLQCFFPTYLSSSQSVRAPDCKTFSAALDIQDTQGDSGDIGLQASRTSLTPFYWTGCPSSHTKDQLFTLCEACLSHKVSFKPAIWRKCCNFTWGRILGKRIGADGLQMASKRPIKSICIRGQSPMKWGEMITVRHFELGALCHVNPQRGIPKCNAHRGRRQCIVIRSKIPNCSTFASTRCRSIREGTCLYMGKKDNANQTTLFTAAAADCFRPLLLPLHASAGYKGMLAGQNQAFTQNKSHPPIPLHPSDHATPPFLQSPIVLRFYQFFTILSWGPEAVAARRRRGLKGT
eukprot:scaffold283561_cov17-Tisochrysis_lutea.AAC.1